MLAIVDNQPQVTVTISESVTMNGPFLLLSRSEATEPWGNSTAILR